MLRIPEPALAELYVCYGKGDVFGATERLQLLSLTETSIHLHDVFAEAL